jgi:hypothetical protein
MDTTPDPRPDAAREAALALARAAAVYEAGHDPFAHVRFRVVADEGPSRAADRRRLREGGA